MTAKQRRQIMQKVIEIKGMTCNHCGEGVKKALDAIDGVEAKVDVKNNIAIVSLSKEVDDHELGNAVIDAGYEVVSIKEDRN